MKKIYSSIFLISMAVAAQAQNISISANASSPDNSAMLDVQSNAKGLLVPRMTLAERNAINLVNNVSQPANGLLIYQTTNNPGFYYNAGTATTPNWLPLTTTDAANLGTGTLSDSRLSTNVTLQGNTVNAANGLVKLNGSSQLPAVSGALLTNLDATDLTGAVAIANGGTGQTSASGALNALLPAQSGNGGKVLTTNGTTSSWSSPAGGAAAAYSITPVSGTSTFAVSSASVITQVFDFQGATGTSQVITLNLLPASSYPAGTILQFFATGYTGGAPGYSLKSQGPGDVFSFFQNNNTPIGTGTGVTVAAAGMRLLTDGSSRYIRVLQ